MKLKLSVDRSLVASMLETFFVISGRGNDLVTTPGRVPISMWFDYIPAGQDGGKNASQRVGAKKPSTQHADSTSLV